MIKYNCNVCDRIYNEVMIHFTSVCTNNCAFCCDKNNNGVNKKDPDVLSIWQTIDTIKDKITDVTISGGEPLLFMEEVDLLCDLIKKNTNLKITLISSIPFIAHLNNGLFFQILDKVDAFAFSPQHYDEMIANKMRSAKDAIYNRQDFYKKLLPYNDKITVNLNIVKPYLSTKEDILKCIEHYNKLGFKHIRISELFDADDMHASFEEIFDIKMHSPFACGCKTDNFDITPWLPDFNGRLDVKRICFLRSNKYHASFTDLIKICTRNIFKKKYTFGVIYEDGSLHPYWC